MGSKCLKIWLWLVVFVCVLKAYTDPENPITPYDDDNDTADIAFWNDDYQKAIVFYSKTSKKGSAWGARGLGDVYFAKKDYGKARFYYNLAIKHYSRHSRLHDGAGFKRGWPSFEDTSLLRASAQLAKIYAEGLGVPKDAKRALALYQRTLVYQKRCTPSPYKWVRADDTIAAFGSKRCKISAISPNHEMQPWVFLSQNFGDAFYYIGNAYMQGVLLPKNMKKALAFLSTAVEFENKDALQGVDRLINLGDAAQKRHHYKEAYDFYKQADGWHSIRALTRLGDLYLEGKGVKQDKDQAGFLYAKAFTRFWKIRTDITSQDSPTWNGDEIYESRFWNPRSNAVLYAAFQLAFLTNTHAFKHFKVVASDQRYSDPPIPGFRAYQSVLLFAKECRQRFLPKFLYPKQSELRTIFAINNDNIPFYPIAHYSTSKECDPELLKPSDFDYKRAKQDKIDTQTLGKALYALAQAYLKGLGTPKDEKLGLEYLKKAVEFENKDAVLALEKWQKPH